MLQTWNMLHRNVLTDINFLNSSSKRSSYYNDPVFFSRLNQNQLHLTTSSQESQRSHMCQESVVTHVSGESVVTHVSGESVVTHVCQESQRHTVRTVQKLPYSHTVRTVQKLPYSHTVRTDIYIYIYYYSK
jgi:CRISPR/Cas system endoribonuclease Cas6 (RAMP superfamily)